MPLVGGAFAAAAQGSDPSATYASAHPLVVARRGERGRLRSPACVTIVVAEGREGHVRLDALELEAPLGCVTVAPLLAVAHVG